MPRVSILLTCYNHRSYLAEALDSIRKQTFRDVEIIALDDGSTDGSREFLSAQTDLDQVIFNQQNLGTYATLNVGLRHAKGELIAIFNDDDLWHPEKLEKQVALLEQHPQVGLVHTDGSFIDGQGRVFEGAPLGFTFPKTETGDVVLALLDANKIIASAALVRRSCFDQLGGFNEGYFGSGDWEMWHRIAEKYEVGFVPEKLTFYRVHGANASHKLEHIWRDDEKLREWIAERTPSYSQRGYDPDQLRRAIAHNWACLGTVRALNGKPGAARAAYRASLKLDPQRWKSRLRILTTFLPISVQKRLL